MPASPSKPEPSPIGPGGAETIGLGEHERRRAAVCVAAATFLFWVSLYLYVPFLPLRALELGASEAMVGAVVAAYAIAQVLLRIPVGVGADLVGRRRPFAVAALVTSALGALGLALSPSPLWLFLARALTGVSAAGWVAVSVLYASYFTAEEASGAMSRIMVVNGIGLVGATLVGGLIAESLGTSATFYTAVAVGALGAALLLVAPEPPLQDRRPYSFATFARVLRTRELIVVAAIGITVQFVTFATSFGFIPVQAQRIGASNAEVGYVTMAMFAASVVGTLAAPSLARRGGNAGAVALGALIVALATGVVPWLDRVMTLGVSQAIAGFGRGATNAVLITLTVLVVPPAQRATAMGLYQAIYAIGMLSGPYVAGLLAGSAGLATTFVVSALVGVAGAALARPLRRTQPLQ